VNAATPRARAKYLPFPRLESIRSRILAFAVVAALVPSGAMLGISYTQNRRALEKKITEDLLSESAQSARATGVWLRERLYDLRVFAGSDEVANTLDRPASTARGALIAPSSQAEGRLRDYLLSLHERFSDFDQLMVLDLDGKVVASSGEITQIRLPADWQSVLRSESQIVGDVYWDATARRAKLVVAVPAQRADGRLIGAFAAGVAAAEACGGDVRLKWPNDLVVGDRKLAGILAETDAAGAVVVGMGCNVQPGALPAELHEIATGVAVDRARLLVEWQELTRHFRRNY